MTTHFSKSSVTPFCTTKT